MTWAAVAGSCEPTTTRTGGPPTRRGVSDAPGTRFRANADARPCAPTGRTLPSAARDAGSGNDVEVLIRGSVRKLDRETSDGCGCERTTCVDNPFHAGAAQFPVPDEPALRRHGRCHNKAAGVQGRRDAHGFHAGMAAQAGIDLLEQELRARFQAPTSGPLGAIRGSSWFQVAGQRVHRDRLGSGGQRLVECFGDDCRYRVQATGREGCRAVEGTGEVVGDDRDFGTHGQGSAIARRRRSLPGPTSAIGEPPAPRGRGPGSRPAVPACRRAGDAQGSGRTCRPPRSCRVA